MRLRNHQDGTVGSGRGFRADSCLSALPAGLPSHRRAFNLSMNHSKEMRRAIKIEVLVP